MMYTDKVMEHFKNPKNMGRIEDYDGLGKVGNPTCGDMMYVYIKVKKIKNKKGYEEILQDIKVETFGCAAAIACASAMTELMIGKTLEDGMNLARSDITNYLGGLPPKKVHCSNLAADALHEAIKDYKGKNSGIKSMQSSKEEKITSIVEKIENEYKNEDEKQVSSSENYEELDKEWKKLQSK